MYISDEERAAAHSGLSTTQAGALVVGSMVGTGVFTTTGWLLAGVGARWAVLLVWLLGGLLALMGAAVYAELGAAFPRVGGEYVYLSRAFSPVVGFLSGWVALIVGFAAPIAAGAAAFGQYVAAALPMVPPGAAALTLLALVTALHARDVITAARLQLGLTAVNLVAMLVFIVGGVHAVATRGIAPPGPLPAAPSWGAIAVGLVLVSYSYFGWNAAAYVAGEMKHPQRALPRALCLGCAVVTALYVGLNAVFVSALPPAALAGKVEVAHMTATALFGPAAAQALSAVVALVLAGSVSALAMTGPRVYTAMAEDGLFFPLFTRRNRRGAPTTGVLLQGALATALFLTAAFDALLIYVGFTLTLSAAATVAAAWWSRRREPERARPFKTPLWPLPPLVFCAASLWMIGHAVLERPRESAAGLATIALGGLVAWLWRRNRAPAHS